MWLCRGLSHVRPADPGRDARNVNQVQLVQEYLESTK